MFKTCFISRNFYQNTRYSLFQEWDEDRLLIALWRNQPDKRIELFLINKYKNKLHNLANKLLLSFKNIAIYPEDLESFQYLSLKKAIDTFSFNWDHKFIQFYVQIFKFMIKDYVKKLSNNGYKILNFAITNLDDYHFNTASCQSSDDLVDKIHTKLLVDKVFHGTEKLSDIEKFVVQHKVKGFHNNEISQMLKVKVKKVDNAYYRALAKLKKNYHNLVNSNE